MKKNFKYYVVAWAILLAIYNVVVFAARPIIPGYTINYDSRFLIAWIVVMISFAGQLACANYAFKEDNKEKLFLGISLVRESYYALVATTVASSVIMLIPDCPAWISAIVSSVVLGFSAVSVIKAKAAADLVTEAGEKVKVKTFFIKSLTVDAESLLARAKNEETREALKNVYEAVRYSDPMSNEALFGVEAQITLKFSALANAVESGDADLVKKLAEELTVLLGNRNNKCKLFK